MAKLIEYSVNTGMVNMAEDSKLLDNAIKNNEKEPIIRFYGWKPRCVSLGRNQSESSVNKKYCDENNIDIVRRITGGRGLLHDCEVTYSFICPVNFLKNGESIIHSYKEISSAIIFGFKELGLELNIGQKQRGKNSFEYCMSLSTGADLCYGSKKLIGSAQYRKQNYILQHGSILFDYNPNIIEKIFNEKTCTNSVTCIKEINRQLNYKDIIECMQKGFSEYFSIVYV